MLKIGITGGIGSGKSTISKIFSCFGIPIYNADEEAKKIMNENEELRRQLVQHFGDAVYTSAGLNRKYLANIVFNDCVALHTLNQLVHQHSLLHFQSWLQEHHHHHLIMKEAALLYESVAHHDLDYIIVVHCNEAERIQRVMKRDGRSKAMVKKIISHQIAGSLKMKLGDAVIYNESDKLVLEQVISIYEKLKQGHLSRSCLL